MERLGIAVCTAVMLMTSAATAESIIVDVGKNSYTLEGGAFAGVFGNGPANFSNDALNLVHDSLHASGITTDGKVTIVAGETDHGLTLMALVDDNTIGGFPIPDSVLGVLSNVDSDASFFVNDLGGEVGLLIEGDGTQTALGAFIWDSDGHGDAMAWAGLDAGDDGSFAFLDIAGDGLEGEDTFQFVSWNGSDWEVVATGDFNSHHHFGFTFAVVPLPAALGLGLVGLAGVAVIGSRRRA